MESAVTGKVAIVMASSRGIGRSIALRLGRDGAAVAVNYVASPEKAEAVVQEIITNGGRSIAIQGNVATKADVTRLFDETEKQLGSIDIVVNVAGVSVFKPHVDLTVKLKCGMWVSSLLHHKSSPKSVTSQ